MLGNVKREYTENQCHIQPYRKIFKLRVRASISTLVCPSIRPWKKMLKTVKNLSKNIFVKGNGYLSMYAHEPSMKLSFGGTLDTRTAYKALK